MRNPFMQHIGMWYSKRENAERVFDLMCKWYKGSDDIDNIRKNNSEMSIYFKNGDWIKFLPTGDGARCQRCTDSFLIDEISDDFINRVIRPVTVRCNGDVHILNTESDSLIYSSIAFRRRKYKWA